MFFEGAIYHVYNRAARGEPVLQDGGEAERFVELLREVVERDGLTVFAWCLMSNHYHIALRTGAIPLAHLGSVDEKPAPAIHTSIQREEGVLRATVAGAIPGQADRRSTVL